MMSMSTAAQQGSPKGVGAYNKSNQSIRSERETERDVIARVTHHLKLAAAKPDDTILAARAVSDNLSLWYVLMTDLAAEGNQLPIELRGRLISVGMAVVRECERQERDKIDIDFLIGVNQALVDGLSEAEK
jgi:flagellar protein FlaF